MNQFSVYKLQFAHSLLPLLSELCDELLIPGILADGTEIYYIINFRRFEVTRIAVNNSQERLSLATKLKSGVSEKHLPYGVNNHYDFTTSWIQPHEGLWLDGERIMIAMHNCSFYRIINLSERTIYTKTINNAMTSATNCRSKDKIYYTETDMLSRISNMESEYSPLLTKVIEFSSETLTRRVVAELLTTEAIHQVQISPDSRKLILTEFCIDLRSQCPSRTPDDNYMTDLSWQRYGGTPLPESFTHQVDINSGKHTSFIPEGLTPGHAEFSSFDSNIFYLSCHSLSKMHGKIIMHAPGRLIKVQISNNGLIPKESFSSADFLRITSHKAFSLDGECYIAVTVYPNWLYIFSDPGMVLLRRIKLFDYENVSAIPYHVCCPGPQIPIWLEITSDGKYIILVSNRVIYIYSVRDNQTHTIDGYHSDNSFIGTGHLSMNKAHC